MWAPFVGKRFVYKWIFPAKVWSVIVDCAESFLGIIEYTSRGTKLHICQIFTGSKNVTAPVIYQIFFNMFFSMWIFLYNPYNIF